MRNGSRVLGVVGIVVVALTVLLASLAAPARAGRQVVVRAGGEAAIAPPMVVFELRHPNGRALAARDDELLGDLLAGLTGAAVLDTGASGTVLSSPTAARYDVSPERGARYVEVGMNGEHTMAVSRPYAIALCEANRRSGCQESLVLRSQRFLLNAPAPERANEHLDALGGDLMALLASPGQATNVVGMPAIREAVVELRSAAEGLAPLAVEIHPRGARVSADHWITLDMVDFNRRRHPKNRGPLPSLAVNPMVPDVRVRAGARAARGDWLLDTGSVVTVLSSRLANEIGLVDRAGRPTRSPDFGLPIGGISGAQKSLPGFYIDRIEIDADDGTTIVVERPAVLVHDVTTKTDDGREHRLDGILGMNILSGSGSGMMMAGFAKTYASAFDRIVIDGPRARLGLTPAR